MDGLRLGVDFGSSNTAAVLRYPDGTRRPILFDGFELLPSAVCRDPAGTLVCGRDALHLGQALPESLELYPKRCIDDGTVLLGQSAAPVAELIGTVLGRVLTEARRVAGGRLLSVTLTHPAGWGSRRLATLLAAAGTVPGLTEVGLVAEPVAAAMHFVSGADGTVPVGRCLVVYDFGAGTCDVTAVRRTASGFEVLARDGLDIGGLDLDAALVDHVGTMFNGRAAERWRRLMRPETGADRRATRQLWSHIRTGKEMLSRTAWTTIHVPLVDEEVVIGRDELEAVAEPVLRSTVRITRRLVVKAGLDAGDLAGVYLVGGSSRIPAVATLLHRALRIAPTVLERPELAVAEGSVLVDAPSATIPQPVTTPPPDEAEAYEPEPEPDGPEPEPDGPEPDEAEPEPDEPEPEIEPDHAPPDRRPIHGLIALALVVVVAASGLTAAVWQVYRDDPNGPDEQPPPGASATGSTGAPWSLRPAGALTGHEDEVSGLAYSRDGSLVATASPDRTVRLWNTVTLASTVVLRHDSGNLPERVAFSGDGRTVAATTSGPSETIVVWDVGTATHVRTIAVQRPRSFADLAFHPSADLVAAAMPFGETGLWNPRTGAQVATLPAANGFTMTAVTFNPAGSVLATGGFDRRATGPRFVGQVRVWDAGTRALLSILPGQQAVPTFSPDGTVLATVGTDNDVITLWDPVGSRAVRTMAAPGKEITAMAFSPDSRILAVSSRDERTGFVDVRTGTVLGSLPDDGTSGSEHILRFAPNGPTLATVSGSQPTVRLWTVPITR